MREDESKAGAGPLVASVLTMAAFCLAGLLVLFGMIFIVPKFAEIFVQLNVPLPAPTRLTLFASRVCVRFWFVVLPLAAILAVLPMVVARRHAWAIYVPATLLMLLLAFVGFVSLYLPIVKIQQMLNKRAPPTALAPLEPRVPGMAEATPGLRDTYWCHTI